MKLKLSWGLLLRRLNLMLHVCMKRERACCTLAARTALSPTSPQPLTVSSRKLPATPGITISVALDYGGREDILEAARSLIREGVPADAVNEGEFRQRLFTGDLPDTDLIIRAGGELRISNFLLWQSAYAEFYVTPTLWPDFGAGMT